jgi:hypothetical protein
MVVRHLLPKSEESVLIARAGNNRHLKIMPHGALNLSSPSSINISNLSNSGVADFVMIL